QLRSSVLNLARRSAVDVGQVYSVNASVQTTGANAYVNEIAASKRVVLFDTLIETYSPDQVDSVVAHELGHVKHRDVPRGLLWIAIVAPAGMLVVQRLTERLAPEDRKSTRLNSSHVAISYAVFCLKKKNNYHRYYVRTSSVNVLP